MMMMRMKWVVLGEMVIGIMLGGVTCFTRVEFRVLG